MALDVDDNGFVVPLDALHVINQLNSVGSHPLTEPFDDSSPDANYLDVSGDGFVAPVDALLIINRLNDLPVNRGVTLQLAHDSGESASDRVTNNADLLGNIAALGAPLTTVKGRLNRGPVFDLTVDEEGRFTVDPQVIQEVPDGDVRFTVYVTDANGADGLRQLRYSLDTVPPTFTAPRIVPADDSGLRNDDGITQRNRPRIAAAAEAGARLRIAIDGAPLFDGTSPGEFEQPTNTLADGPHDLEASAADLAGNTTSSGRISLVIDTLPPSPPAFDLALASDSGIRGDRATRDARVTLSGSTEGNSFITVSGLAETVRSSGDGTFRIPNLPLNPGINSFTLDVTDLAGNTSSGSQSITRASEPASVDPVLRWNQAMLNAIVSDATPPPLATRGLAMVSIAMLDVVNAVEGTPSYLVSLDSPANVSIESAISSAAFTVLSYLYPGQAPAIQAVQSAALAEIPEGDAKSQGMLFGTRVGEAVIALRDRDGWNTFVDHAPGSAPGEWQETAPMYDVALAPQWGRLTPFAVSDVAALAPPGPPELASQEWADAYDEVKSLGRATGSTRTAEQTQIARFWADGAGTYSPPGHWNQIAAQFSAAQGLSVGENARLFAMLNSALGDAAIVAWNAKYATDFWRPITAIQNADQDGNDQTTADANWTSLLITPPFPEYVSGHSTFSGAAAAILTDYFGDNQAFTTNSLGLPGVNRTFSSFTAAAEEASRSRIYGGIHYSFSGEDGLAAGRAIAAEVLARFTVADDTRAPQIVFLAPPDDSVTNVSPAVQGWALDNLAGVAGATVQVEDGPVVAVALDAEGRFTFTPSFALDGSADGRHLLHFRAVDQAGWQSANFDFKFTLDSLAPTVTVDSPVAGATLAATSTLTGTASGTGSSLVALTYQIDAGPRTPLSFDPTGGGFSQPLELSRVAIGSHTLVVTARDAAGLETASTVHFTLDALAPLTVASYVPQSGASDIGSTFRPQVFFSRPINPSTLNSNNFFATDTTGAKLPATIVPAQDGSFAWLFFTKPMPGGSTISVHVNGESILGADGTKLDADGDGAAGGELIFRYATVSLAPLAGTSLSGRVVDPGDDLKPMTFDDIRAGADGILHSPDDLFLNPIAHAKVYVLGLENQYVYTDANGLFSLPSVPGGNIKLAIDGRTATNSPTGTFWPEMVMDLDMEIGQANTVMGTMGTREEREANLTRSEVYLPRIRTAALQSVSATVPTTITVAPESAANLTAEQRSHLSLRTQPGAALDANGQVIAAPQIGISTVPPELVRDMLPPGLMQHTFDITIQAPGTATFATPLTMTFPNVFGAAPGTKLNFLSFDHTTGRLVIEGPATVSADGLSATTDPGQGITKPGWHGLTPPASSVPPPCRPQNLGLIGSPLEEVKVLLSLVKQQFESFLEDVERLRKGYENLQQDIESIRQLYAHDPVEACLALFRLQPLWNSLTNQASSLVGAKLNFLKSVDARLERAEEAARGIIKLGELLGAECQDDPRLEDLRHKASIALAFISGARVVTSSIEGLAKGLSDYVSGVAFESLVGTFCDENQFVQASTPFAQLNAAVGESREKATRLLQDSATVAVTEQHLRPVESARDVVNSELPLFSTAYFEFKVGDFSIRGRAESYSEITALLPPSSPFTLTVAAFPSLKYAQVRGESAVSGIKTDTPLLRFSEPADEGDIDKDGLLDVMEDVIGTDVSQVDSNGDGIGDLTSLLQGLDPRIDRPVLGGVLASVPLLGVTNTVVLAGSIFNPDGQTAYVATGSYGLAIVDASRFQKPIVLSQLDLPGDATDVAVDSRLSLAAVAANSGGLAVVDVSDSNGPAVIRTVNGTFGQVEVVDGIAYAASQGELRAYDLLTGERLQTLSLGGSDVISLALANSFLYSLDANRVFRAFEVGAGGLLVARGSLTLPAGGGKVFVGGGVAYVGANNGFVTVNVSNPNSLTLLSGVDATNIAGAALAANGSGLAIGVANLGFGIGNVVQVLNVSDPANTNGFVTQFSLPAAPYDVTLGAGIAFVADGAGGLVVVNYLPFDNQGVPPTVNISAAVTDVDLATPGIQVQEGTTVAVTPVIADDVQVRNVELLVDGVVVQNDVSFPFELPAVVPNLPIGVTTQPLTVAVRATDTGGNVTTSVPVSLNISPDTTAPTLVSTFPPEGTKRGQAFRTVVLGFSEPMDTSTLTAANVRLIGPDGPETPTNIQFRRGNREVQFTYDSLSVGAQRLEIDRGAIMDRAGNPLGTGLQTSQFTIVQATAVFINSAGGFWDVASNWDTGILPGPTDDVLLDVASGATVTFRSGNSTIRSLLSTNPFTLSGGALTVTETVRVNNTFTLAGGTLKDATILAGAGGQGLILTNSGGTLAGVTVAAGATLDATRTNASYPGNYDYALVTGGLTLLGTANLGAANGSTYGQLHFLGSQTLGGTGTVVLGSSISNALYERTNGAGTLTIASGITVQGGGGIVSGYGSYGASESIVNQGVITVPTGRSLTLGGVNWSNEGTITADGANVTLGGSFSTAALGSFSAVGGNVSLTGTLNNGNATLTLQPSLGGSWSLAGGAISGGTIASSDGAALVLTNAGGTLAGVTVAAGATLDATRTNASYPGNYDYAFVTGGLTLLGTANLGAANGSTYGQLHFLGSQTLSGTGTVVLGSSISNALYERTNGAGTLMIGGGITVQGGSGIVSGYGSYGASESIVNQGAITVPTGRSLTLGGVNWSNEGTITANGANVTLGGSFSTAALGSFSAVGGNVSLTGTLNNGNATLTLQPSLGGSWSLAGGAISGGTIASSDGAALVLTNAGGTLAGVTVAAGATLDATRTNASYPGNYDYALVTGGLTLLGTANLGAANGSTYGQLHFLGSQTLGGTGTVVFGSSMSNALYERTNSAGTLMIGSGITVQGGSGIVSGYGSYGASESIVNQGAITVPTGRSLNLGGVNWSNEGTITADGANVTLGGSFTTAALGDFSAVGGAVSLTGTLKNENATLTLQPALGGSWSLAGGAISGGTIASSDGAALVLTNAGGTLAGVTIAAGATIDATRPNASYPGNYDYAFVTGGLTLLGTANLGAANGSTYGQLHFLGSQTLGGTGTVVFGSSVSNALYERTNGAGTLTVASGITVQGGSGSVSGYGSYGASESIVNQGTIHVNGTGTSINVRAYGAGTLTNAGELKATDGGILNIANLTPSHSGAILAGAGSVVQISGTLDQAAAGQVTVEVRGLGNGNLGRVIVANAASLAGTLNVNFVNGYVANAGDSFQLLTFTSRSGEFTTVNINGLGVGKVLDVTYNATNVTATVANALTVANLPPVSAADVLARETLESIVAAGISLLVEAGLNFAGAQRLQSISFQTADLGPGYLGYAVGNTVWIDDNAAGYGWFVDSSPEDFAEFESAVGVNTRLANAESAAADRIDLLTVILHELGHELDLEHSEQPDDLMYETLMPSQRKLLSPSDVDSLFGS